MARLLFLLAALLPALAAAFLAPAPFRATASAGSRVLIPEVRDATCSGRACAHLI